MHKIKVLYGIKIKVLLTHRPKIKMLLIKNCKISTIINSVWHRRWKETYLRHCERAGVSDAGEQNGQEPVRVARTFSTAADPAGSLSGRSRAGLPSADGPERRKQPVCRPPHAKHTRYDMHTYSCSYFFFCKSIHVAFKKKKDLKIRLPGCMMHILSFEWFTILHLNSLKWNHSDCCPINTIISVSPVCSINRSPVYRV